MLLSIYSAYDNKAHAFGRPFFCQSDGVAIRAVIESAQDKTSEFAKYPDDYAIFAIGEFDDQAGELIPKQPRNLGLVSTIVEGYIASRKGPSDAVSDESQLRSRTASGNSKKHIRQDTRSQNDV